MAIARDARESGALFNWVKTLANNASWLEDFQVIQDGEAMDWSDLTVKFTLRDCANGSAVLTLTSGDGYVALKAGDDTTLQVSVPPSVLSSLCGDYIGDIAFQDTDDNVILLAHGTVTVTNNPPVF